MASLTSRVGQALALLLNLCVAVWCSSPTPQPLDQHEVEESGLPTQQTVQYQPPPPGAAVGGEVLGDGEFPVLTTSNVPLSDKESKITTTGSEVNLKPRMLDTWRNISRSSSESLAGSDSHENQGSSADVVKSNASATPDNSWFQSHVSSTNGSADNPESASSASQNQAGQDKGAVEHQVTKCDSCASSQDICQAGEVCETDNFCIKWCRKPDGSSIPAVTHVQKEGPGAVDSLFNGSQNKTRKAASGPQSFFALSFELPPVAMRVKEAVVNKINTKPHTCDDQCKLFGSLCKMGEVCVTIKTENGCKMKCRGADGSEASLGSHMSTVPPRTLRPLSERRCEISGKECIQGTCAGGLNCTCDRGFVGELCSQLECHFPCSHGVCYRRSPVVEECACDPGWGGVQCHLPNCSRRCENGGACMWDGKPSPSMICTCKDPWIGDSCDRVKPKASNNLALAVGIGAPVACILVLMISWYILWRKRVILVFKIINMFKAYEDDDDKLYDAYVSLTESDTDYVFVKHVLQPKLEDMGHRLYLHARDGSAGVKSEEILKAVEKSRRCIMLLTSDYINNEWCRFEYLIAQHETCIKLKQRIIPILMDDIDKDKKKMDKTLRFIVDSVKCLRYPIPPPELSDGQFSPIDLESGHPKSKELASFERRQARFFERLRLCMPKKREPSEVTSPTLSCNSQCPLSEHVHYNNKKGVRLFLDSFASIFPFGVGGDKSGTNTYTLSTQSSQSSACGRAGDRPSVTVISSASLEDPNLHSFYQSVTNDSQNKNNSESGLKEDGLHSQQKNGYDAKPLRLEIPS
ncbi:hypothetical protein EGW08_019157 [Elysia chlorotica]|uniref:TIR domain-containing protein n=1 Tax=Elysia chlorotica TaxID=188477 RepID=A0A3S1AV62_ELYCH|nr:hypothetical protein EGW08_019157 [Elysia chlorotica]